MDHASPNILLLGGTGFVGRELGQHLVALGYTVTVATRSPEKVRGFLPFPFKILPWDGQEIPSGAIESCDAVVNLVGEGIADKPWTQGRRAAIVDSRNRSVVALAAAVRGAKKKPRVIIQATAIGYYGDRGEEELTESSLAGSGFLADTCVSWESGLQNIEKQGVRLVTLRLGMVLGNTGGALPKLLSVYGKGLGATLGSGRQWMSWIHVADLVKMISTAIASDAWSGTHRSRRHLQLQLRSF